jgi:hypothetical protein
VNSLGWVSVVVTGGSVSTACGCVPVKVGRSRVVGRERKMPGRHEPPQVVGFSGFLPRSSGDIRYCEDIAEGLRAAPGASRMACGIMV